MIKLNLGEMLHSNRLPISSHMTSARVRSNGVPLLDDFLVREEQ
jgi:hypothetical protein